MTVPEKAFVNLFWGDKDAGFSAIQLKIKTSLRTLHELLDFYKEKILIEKEYNKRLSKLSSSITLGSGEIGSLKIALDKLQNESGNMISQNLSFIRDVLTHNYEKLNRFYQMYHKNVTKLEAHMQRLLQKKNDFLAYLENAKEKYRNACGQQKTLTLLCQTTWGKELEKNSAKLQKVLQSLASLETSYQEAVVKNAELHEVWVRDWSVALLNIYQLEIERIQVCKLNCFAYCNHIASLCVDWDLAVDAARNTFARVGAPKDVDDFVEEYGTGSQIPAPPEYVDFLNGFDDDRPQVYTTADFKDPDYSHILSRTFSTHSNIVGNALPNAAERGDTRPLNVPTPYTPVKPILNKTLPPIKEPLTPSPGLRLNGNFLPSEAMHPTTEKDGLRKQPSHNSNYTSGAEDRHDVFDRGSRMQNSNTLSDYSSPTNYSGHTGRSWSLPKKKVAQEVQKEINRRSQDFSGVFSGSPQNQSAAGEQRRKSVPIAKDFSIDFIAKALEDLNAGGDGDMNKFRRSVRMENASLEPQMPPQVVPALDYVDDLQETAQRYDSISFRSPQRNQMLLNLPAKSANHTATDDDLLHTVVKKSATTKPSREARRRSILQSPTKSYVNLLALVDKVTPVTRNKYETKAVARYNYTAREQGELSFKKGWHMFIIHRQEDNWYVCELGENCGAERGSVGLVPYNYIVEGDKVF